METGVTFRNGIWVCLGQPLTHVPMTHRLEGVALGFLASVARAGIRGCASVTPRPAPSVSLASLSPVLAGRLLWLRAAAGPSELKIAL